jgi:hypothetical protein
VGNFFDIEVTFERFLNLCAKGGGGGPQSQFTECVLFKKIVLKSESSYFVKGTIAKFYAD